MFGAINMMSHNLLTQMKLSSTFFQALTVGLDFFIISSKERKSFQINFSKDIWLYLGKDYRGIFLFRMINKNRVLLYFFH